MQAETQLKKKGRVLDSFLVPFTKSRAFPYLWLSQLISMVGSSITTVILPMVVYSLTGSTTMMGFVMGIYMLPYVLMLPLSGWIVDRYDRVRIMMLSDLIRFVIMLILALLIFTGVLSMPLLFVLIGVYGLMEGLFQPAYSAVRATVFTPDIRNAANALTQMSNQTVRLIGPVLGGLLVSYLSPSYGFGLDALTYLISFLCLVYLVKYLTMELPGKKAGAASSSSWKNDLLDGISILRGHPWLWITILAFSFINICFSGIIVVLVPWLFKVAERTDFAPDALHRLCSRPRFTHGARRLWPDDIRPDLGNKPPRASPCGSLRPCRQPGFA